MKLANGTGSITKLKGKRRRPYWVRSPEIVYEENGVIKRKRKTIGYAKTQKEALMLLSEYISSPYDLGDYTVQMVWEKTKDWMSWKEYRVKALDGIFNNYYKVLSPMKMIDIKTENLQMLFDNCNKSVSTKNELKVIARALFKYALANDIVKKDYSEFITITDDTKKKERILFADTEILNLWNLPNRDWMADLMLILLYTGCRVKEITENTIDSLNLENKSIYVPESCAKTESSIRYIPIHEKILPIIEKYAGKEYLFEVNGNKINYKKLYHKELPELCASIGMKNHTFHDARHTFITQMRSLGVELFYIDEITGHRHNNISDDTYTHIDIERLHEEMKKLKY